jgi:ubiquinone/menaquinone biosynthesis C-methylase UbiE
VGDESAIPDDAVPGAPEAYTFRAAAPVEALFAQRTGAVEAAFFLPYLRPGLRLLDVGCGPGSLTCDLAEVVAPGEVVGLDSQPVQVARAAALAQERGLTTVRFEVGSIYALPFPDASFDAAFAHQVLLHLSDPLAALRELRRVLKPGGIVGLRDAHMGLWHTSPPMPLLDAHKALAIRVLQQNGGNPFYAGQQRQLLLEAGFARSEASAAFYGDGVGSLAKTRARAQLDMALLRAATPLVLKQGLSDQDGLDAMCAALEQWGERPDALSLVTHCMAVGWNAG